MSEKPLLSLLFEKVKGLNRRLVFAMACYIILLAVALYVVLPVRSDYERYLLGFVLFVFTMLIFRTLVHAKKGDLD